MAFTINQNVKFDRNRIQKETSVKVVAVLSKPGRIDYIIETTLPIGWTPSALRVEKFSLDPVKKYLFVNEDELTAI